MAINKVIYGGRTLIDLSGDTVTADKILDGFTAHDKKGDTITGTCKYDVDSSDATPNHRPRQLHRKPQNRLYYQILKKDITTYHRLQLQQFRIRKVKIPLEVPR